MVSTRYSHTNIVARDPERLADFYETVFECERDVERYLSGDWLARGMGLPGAKLHVIHLRLPGQGAGGPTLELFGVADAQLDGPSPPNRTGLMHMAFAVADIRATLARLLESGGEPLGDISEADLEGVGRVEFMYGRDPEGNIVELQEYKTPAVA
jgi:predicted enzyme related to lactoylglutathione lyase